MPKVKSALHTLGIRPQWLNTRERNQVFFLELRAELTQAAEGETALAEYIARGIWSAIGRFVRIVFIFPYLDIWPGGLEFGENDYVRIMRQRSGPNVR